MNIIRENGKEDCGNIKLIGSQVYQALYVCPTTQRFWKSIILVVFYNVSQEKDQVQGFPFNVNAFPILSATFDWIFGNLVSTSFIFIQTLHFDFWNWHQNLAVKSFYYCCVGRFSIRGLMHDPRSVSKVAGNTEQGSASDLFQPLEKKNRTISKEYVKCSDIFCHDKRLSNCSQTPCWSKLINCGFCWNRTLHYFLLFVCVQA